MKCQCGLFSRRLHVGVDQDALRPGIRGQKLIRGLKRVIGRKSHEDPSEDVEDEDFTPPRFRGERKTKAPLSGRVTREIRRTTDRLA